MLSAQTKLLSNYARIESMAEPSPKRLRVSESDDKDEAEQISSPYYLENLKFILDCVLGSDSVDKIALKEEDVSCIRKFRALGGTL